ncbi:hypothetical protein AAC387_Pa11g0408 [Persea americana]
MPLKDSFGSTISYGMRINLPNLLDLYLDHLNLVLDKGSLSSLQEAAGECQLAKWLLLSSSKGCEYEASFSYARSIVSHNIVQNGSIGVQEVDEIICTVDDTAGGELPSRPLYMLLPHSTMLVKWNHTEIGSDVVQGPLGWQSVGVAVPAGESIPQRANYFDFNANGNAELSSISWEAAIHISIEEELFASSFEVLPLAVLHFENTVLVVSCAFLLVLCGLSASMLRVDVAALWRISSFYKSTKYSKHYNHLSPKGSAFHAVSHEVDLTVSLARALADDYQHHNKFSLMGKMVLLIEL